MKKEELKNYNVLCSNSQEVKECLIYLRKIGFETQNIKQNLPNNHIIVRYSNIFCATNILSEDKVNISYLSFKSLIFTIIEEEKEDFITNDKGQIIDITNYESNKRICYLNFDYNFDFIEFNYIGDMSPRHLDYLKDVGILFDTKENAEKFIEYIKNY